MPARDAFTCLLKRRPPDTEALWHEAGRLIEKDEGLLILDDTTLDKPYANRMDLVTYHWSGKHRRIVKGINLITLLWTDAMDWPSYPATSGYTIRQAQRPDEERNDHFQAMLRKAKRRIGALS